jgi:hypothetical protein
MLVNGIIATKEDADAFCGSCVSLRALWRHYCTLFKGSDLKRELLQTTAPVFFGDLNLIFIERLVQRVCRLTDNKPTMGRHAHWHRCENRRRVRPCRGDWVGAAGKPKEVLQCHASTFRSERVGGKLQRCWEWLGRCRWRAAHPRQSSVLPKIQPGKTLCRVT